MWRIADLIEEHAEELAQLDALNTGMPLMQARLICLPPPNSSATTRVGAPSFTAPHMT